MFTVKNQGSHCCENDSFVFNTDHENVTFKNESNYVLENDNRNIFCLNF